MREKRSLSLGAPCRALVALCLWACCIPELGAAEALRIVEVDVLDKGVVNESLSTDLNVDLVQDLCGDEEDPTDEPFYDTFVSTSVRNPLSQDISIHRVRYRLREEVGGRRTLSRAMAPFIGNPISARATASVVSLMLKATDGSKRLVSSGAAMDPALGVQHITVILTGRTSGGKRITLRKRVSMAFANYDRCG